MSERDIRARVRAAFAELDRRAGRRVRNAVMPALLGAGLALGAGACDGRVVKQDAAANTDGAARIDGGMLPPYSAPLPADAGIDLVPPPTADYAAPMPELRRDGG